MSINRYLVTLLFLTISFFGFSQGSFLLKKGLKQHKIKFQLINNLIVFPVEVNGVELSFLLDTGVSKPIIFNFLNITDSLQIKNTEKIFLRGLGEGDYVEAYKSKNNFFKIGEAFNINQDLFIVFDPSLNFAPRLGVPIHGIIGYDVFKDFIVEVNYSKKFLKLMDRRYFKPKRYRKYELLSLNFKNTKPYLNASIVNKDKIIPLKLLIDTGGGDALWLFEDDQKGINIPKLYFDDFLGKGLSGSIYGKRSKTKEFMLGSYKFKNVNVAYPDSSSIEGARSYKERNGSVSGNILKRFNHVFNYADSTLLIKKNKNFREPFYYNKSGIILEHDGVRLVKESERGFNNLVKNESNSTFSRTKILLETNFKYLLSPAFVIAELRKGSPAEKAGLLLGDVIITINNKGAHNFSLQEITQMFYDEDEKLVRLKIERYGQFLDYKFRLESLFKKPQ